jgi:hypothetical protein
MTNAADFCLIAEQRFRSTPEGLEYLNKSDSVLYSAASTLTKG